MAAGLLVACGDAEHPQRGADEQSTTTLDRAGGPTSTARGDDGELPSASPLDLVPDYGLALQALGLRLTDRGGLIDRDGGGYVPSAEGRHLALYVEPIGDRTVQQYIDGVRAATAVFADVFQRWPGLESFDVCQEPVDGAGGSGGTSEPVPITQVEVTREQASVIDWESSTVVDLVRAAGTDPPGLALRVSQPVAQDPAYRAILDLVR